MNRLLASVGRKQGFTRSNGDWFREGGHGRRKVARGQVRRDKVERPQPARLAERGGGGEAPIPTPHTNWHGTRCCSQLPNRTGNSRGFRFPQQGAQGRGTAGRGGPRAACARSGWCRSGQSTQTPARAARVRGGGGRAGSGEGAGERPATAAALRARAQHWYGRGCVSG